MWKVEGGDFKKCWLRFPQGSSYETMASKNWRQHLQLARKVRSQVIVTLARGTECRKFQGAVMGDKEAGGKKDQAHAGAGL